MIVICHESAQHGQFEGDLCSKMDVKRQRWFEFAERVDGERCEWQKKTNTQSKVNQALE